MRAFKLGAGKLRAELRTRSDKAVAIKGTLGGSPSAPGSTVCLYEQVDLPGDARELVDIAKVRNDGTFGFAVEPGPSRHFGVSYRFNNATLEREQLRLESVCGRASRSLAANSSATGKRCASAAVSRDRTPAGVLSRFRPTPATSGAPSRS